MARAPRQLFFDLPPATPARAALVVTDANRDAARLAGAPALWPTGVACVVGPAGAGKSRLVGEVYRPDATLDAAALAAASLEQGAAAPGARLAFEDVDAALEAAGGAAAELEGALFHLLNRLAAAGPAGARLLLTARTPPSRWAVRLPDLRTRLAATPAARIEEPDDALLAGMLRARLAAEGFSAPDALLAFLAPRMERSFAAIARVAETLCAHARAERATLTREAAARALGWRAPEDADQEDDAGDGAERRESGAGPVVE